MWEGPRGASLRGGDFVPLGGCGGFVPLGGCGGRAGVGQQQEGPPQPHTLPL